MKWLEKKLEQDFTSHAVILALYSLVKSLLVKLKNLYIHPGLMLIMERQGSNQKWDFSILLIIISLSLILATFQKRDLNLKFRSKFNHGFPNQDYLRCAIQKALQKVKVKRSHETKDQFLFQNVQNLIFDIFTTFKNSMHFTKAAR